MGQCLALPVTRQLVALPRLDRNANGRGTQAQVMGALELQHQAGWLIVVIVEIARDAHSIGQAAHAPVQRASLTQLSRKITIGHITGPIVTIQLGPQRYGAIYLALIEQEIDISQKTAGIPESGQPLPAAMPLRPVHCRAADGQNHMVAGQVLLAISAARRQHCGSISWSGSSIQRRTINRAWATSPGAPSSQRRRLKLGQIAIPGMQRNLRGAPANRSVTRLNRYRGFEIGGQRSARKLTLQAGIDPGQVQPRAPHPAGKWVVACSIR